MVADEVFENVLNHFKVESRCGNKAQCHCSAHDDKRGSLTITKGEKAIALKCHAGCKTEDVVSAAGLKMRDLFYDSKPRRPNWKSYVERKEGRKIEAVYNYVHMDGTYAFTKVRLEGKEMRFGILVNDRFSYGLHGRKLKDICAIYAPNGVQAINKAISEGKPIFIPEGTKDVDTLTKQGYTSFTYGSSSHWQSGFSSLVSNADVFILADNDNEGMRVAETIQKDIEMIAKSSKIIVPMPDVPHGDISDFFEAGHTKQEFEAMLQEERKPLKEKTVGGSDKCNVSIPQARQDEEIDYTPFHFYNNKGEVTGINHFNIAEDIKAKHSLFVSGFFYESEGGHYKPDVTGTKVKGYIKRRILQDKIKSQVINQIYNLLHDDFSIERDFKDANIYPVRWVPFEDCLFDPLTFEEIPYDDKYYCTNRLPHKWRICKNAAEGKEIEKFLHFAIPDEQDREMALGFDGLSCNRDTSFQKAILEVGQGGSGKSIKIRLLQAMLGADNYSNISLFDLGKRFMPGLLLGKLANICSDLPLVALKDEASEALKLIVGEDVIFHESKGQNGFFFTPFCKMTFSTNSLPQVLDERNNAIYRRLLILRMDNTPEHPDVNLFSKLENELPYYIKLCMEALHRIYERGRIFESENSKHEIDQMRRDSDTTEDFLDVHCVKVSGARIDRGELFTKYDQHCKDEGRQSLSKNAFNKAMRAKGYKQVKSCGRWFFEGISLKKSSLNLPSENRKSSLNGVEVDADDFMRVDEEALKGLPFT